MAHIELPLEMFNFGGAPRPAIRVEVDDAMEVSLTIDLEKHEFLNRSLRRTEILTDVIRAGDGIDEPVIANLQAALVKLAEDYDNLWAAVHETSDTVDRRLTANEARALAAMLTHFANESERPR